MTHFLVQIKKNTFEAHQKAETSEAMAKRINKALVKIESNMAIVRNALTITRANIVMARADFELEK